MISEERLAQLRFQAANNGYTPQYMGAMRKAGTVPKHATPVTVIASELIQLVGAYDQLQASMRAAAAVPEDVLALLRDLEPALDAYERSGRTSEIKDGALHWTLDARHYDAQRLRSRVEALLAAANKENTNE